MHSLKILFENEHLIAVDKDRGIAVHGGESIPREETLLHAVKRYLGTSPDDFVTPAHRLDRNTRGPVIFAKDRETMASLTRAFACGEAKKTYSALLEGRIDTPLFIEADIVKSRHKKSVVKNMKILSEEIPEKETWLAAKNPKSVTISGTVIRPLAVYGDTTLCSIMIWTGRYHQIRAVCEAIGHPVCGDNKYNHNPRFYYNRRTNPDYPDNQMLLCKTLELPSLGIFLTSSFDLRPVSGKSDV